SLSGRVSISRQAQKSGHYKKLQKSGPAHARGIAVGEDSLVWVVQEPWTLSASSKPMALIPAPRAGRRQTFVSADQARGLLNANVGAAEVRARKFLETNSDDSDALYLLAAAFRRTGRHVEAAAILQPLTGSQP